MAFPTTSDFSATPLFIFPVLISQWHSSPKRVGHYSCPRPVDVLVAIIEDYTVPGALILDPTVGSGSVCLAASRFKPSRRYIGIEISEGYAALARRQIEKETK